MLCCSVVTPPNMLWLFGGVTPKQPFPLKALLNNFGDSTGLKVNYRKSIIVPINVSKGRIQHLALTFNCQVCDTLGVSKLLKKILQLPTNYLEP